MWCRFVGQEIHASSTHGGLGRYLHSTNHGHFRPNGPTAPQMTWSVSWGILIIWEMAVIFHSAGMTSLNWWSWQVVNKGSSWRCSFYDGNLLGRSVRIPDVSPGGLGEVAFIVNFAGIRNATPHSFTGILMSHSSNATSNWVQLFQAYYHLVI